MKKRRTETERQNETKTGGDTETESQMNGCHRVPHIGTERTCPQEHKVKNIGPSEGVHSP